MSPSAPALYLNMTTKKDWFKIKKYPHIGRPLLNADRTWVSKYVADNIAISKHSFYPFIHRGTTVRKFRRVTNKITLRKSENRIASSKRRDLYYANHLDSCVFSYYAKLLSESYETNLQAEGLENIVTAYRRIKVDPQRVTSPHKSSADFASDVFNFILNSVDDELVAITFDIKGFFDNLDHKLLKRSWRNLKGDKTLGDDEYNVFKNITNFSYINENQLFDEFKHEIITVSKSGIEKKKKINKIHHLRKQRAQAFCELSDIKRIREKKLIVGNNSPNHPKRNKGIPQGSPISAVLANIYMFDFDKAINRNITDLGGIYRRYSDDMIIVCDKKYTDVILRMFDDYISNVLLEVQHDKTQIFNFTKKGSRYECSQKIGKPLKPNKNLEYLGFEFDGFNTLLKSSSLSSFYRKMKRSHARSLYYSKSLKTSKSYGHIFKTRLFKKFSYKGAGRRRIYIQDKVDPGKWIKTETYDWGNYISYAQLAINKMPNNKIKGQIKRHWKILNKLIT